MGKSNKKFKAERINAIRKQFSSFIEEDKKRKDRNEYILERLDKIRTGSAIVQVRNAPKDFLVKVNQNHFAYDPKDYTEKIIPMYGKPQYCFNTVDNTNVVTTKSEQEMLKEISQKYILIPRHSNILEYDDNCLFKYKIDDNNDWRTKYRILEQLKQSEKEDAQKATTDLCKKFTTINIKGGELSDSKIEQPNLQTQLLLTEFNEHSSEKNQDNLWMTGSTDDANVNVNDRHTKKSKIEKDIDNSVNIKDLNKPISNSETERNTDTITQATTSVTTPQAPTSDENVNVADNLVNEHNAVQIDVKTDDLTKKEKIQTQYEMEQKPNEEDILLKKVQYSNIDAENQINYPPENGEIQVRDEDSITSNTDSEKLRSSGINEPLPVENINFNVQNTEHEEAKSVVDQLESQEVLTMVYPTEEELENTGFESQIDDFVAEQTDMLYSDPNISNYAYDQTGSHVDYAYYEGIPPDQPVYGGVVNDHEETTEQYDHNYKSQYSDYDQAQLIDVQHDVYDVEEDVAEPETYEQIQFEEPDYNDVKEIEKELDDEQSYNVMPPSQDDDISNIIDEAILPEGDSNVKKT